MLDKEKYEFNGKEAEVEWDSRLCIHIAECGKSQGELFVGGRDPWCQPDLVSKTDVAEIVTRCPTGALTFKIRDGSIREQAPGINTLLVSNDGPYYLRGDLNIEGAPEDMPAIQFRAALCRCGASKNKPFCDNSHEEAGFKDHGAVGVKGDTLKEKGGKLNIKSLKDAALLIEGNLTIRNGSGRISWQGKQVGLCRCGASKNKPFCDGSHIGAGFKDDSRS